MDVLESAKSGKSRKGQMQLIRYLEGRKITRQQAINAKCYDCDGMGDSGLCDIETCSLFPFSPYNAPCEALSEI